MLGKITEYLPHPDAAILTTQAAVRVSIGDEVIVRGHLTCFSVKIIDLQDHDQSVETTNANAGNELGVRFNPTVAKEGVLIFRLRSADSPGGGDIAVAYAAPSDEAPAPAAEAVAPSADAAPAAAAGADVDALKAGGAWKCVLNVLHNLRRWFHR